MVCVVCVWGVWVCECVCVLPPDAAGTCLMSGLCIPKACPKPAVRDSQEGVRQELSFALQGG